MAHTEMRQWTRRRFLQTLARAGAGGTVVTLAGCAPPGLRQLIDAQATETAPATLGLQPQSTAPRTATSMPTPTLQPAPTVTKAPTATPILDLPRFDEASLAPVYVAHNLEVDGYPALPPFDPDEQYPEYPFAGGVQPGNAAYWLVRRALALMSPAGFGSAEWNPLGAVIRPGDVVLIKPNLVDDSRWEKGQTTHPAFLRPVIDYAYRACGPTGQILVAEGPWTAGLFDAMVTRMGIREMVRYLAEIHGLPVGLVDLNKGERETTPLVDLGAASALRAAEYTWFDAHGQVMEEGGDPGIGRYYIAKAVLDADVILSVPKLKVHCSGGITVTMKNMIGIIPAWDGPYERAELKDCAHTSDVDRTAGSRGMYLENDTIWRSMADLNRILLYCDRQGQLQTTRQRRYLTLVDGIIAAEASQYDPQPHPLGTVIVGANPVTVDAVAARCMGFDPRRFRSVVNPTQRMDFPLGPYAAERIRIVMEPGTDIGSTYRESLTPELGIYSWQGHVEATDFDAPVIADWQWNAADGVLYVGCRDVVGVSWVRARYVVEGEVRVKDMALHAGSPVDGQWRTEFPLGNSTSEVTLEACDSLYNQSSILVVL